MAVKYYALKHVDHFSKGDEITEGFYTDDHLERMVALRVLRRETVNDPKPAPAKQTAKKAASKKSASSK